MSETNNSPIANAVRHHVTGGPNVLFSFGVDLNNEHMEDLSGSANDVLECAHGMAYMLGVALRGAQKEWDGVDESLAPDVLVRSIEGIALLTSLAVELHRGAAAQQRAKQGRKAA